MRCSHGRGNRTGFRGHVTLTPRYFARPRTRFARLRVVTNPAQTSIKSLNPFTYKSEIDCGMRRIALRLSGAEVGEALDISRQQVQKYESGVDELSAAQGI
jgi:hypothetical protein